MVRSTSASRRQCTDATCLLVFNGGGGTGGCDRRGVRAIRAGHVGAEQPCLTIRTLCDVPECGQLRGTSVSLQYDPRGSMTTSVTNAVVGSVWSLYDGIAGYGGGGECSLRGGSSPAPPRPQPVLLNFKRRQSRRRKFLV